VGEVDEIMVWDLAKRKSLFRLPGHGRFGGNALVITSDGSRLMSFGGDYFLRATDLATGKAVVDFLVRPEGVELPDDEKSGRREMFALRFGPPVFSPDGRRFAWNLGKDIHVFDVNTGKPTCKIGNPGTIMGSLVFSHDGSKLFGTCWGHPVKRILPNGDTRSATEDSLVSSWNIENGEVIYSVKVPELQIQNPTFSPDGERVALLVNGSKPRVFLLSASEGKTLNEIGLPAIPAGKIAFTPDGKRIACAMSDSTVLFFDLELRKGE
jgi:WD40 repeat protein